MAGLYYEDFEVGQVLDHATPRTVTEGDRALYQAFFGSRFSLQSSDEVARKAGYDAQAQKLVKMFIENFAKFEDHVDPDVRAAAPTAKRAAE